MVVICVTVAATVIVGTKHISLLCVNFNEFIINRISVANHFAGWYLDTFIRTIDKLRHEAVIVHRGAGASRPEFTVVFRKGVGYDILGGCVID